VLIVVPPFVVLGSTLIKLVFFGIRDHSVTAVLLFKLLLSAIWECLLFLISALLLREFGPISSNTLLAWLLAGWAIAFSGFSLYPNQLLIKKDTLVLSKRIQLGLVLGLIAPVITIMLCTHL